MGGIRYNLTHYRAFSTISKGDNPFKEDFNYQNIQNLKFPKKNTSVKLHTVNDLDPCLMLFTSGTTGKPKGVLLHGKMLRSNQIETCRGWGLRSTDKTIVETPFFHTGGYNVLCLPLLSIGGEIIIAAEFNLKTLFETIQKDKITVYFGVPTMFQMMLEHSRVDNVDFSSIRFFVSGGAHCPQKVIESFQKKGIVFKQGFGLTEVGPNCFLLEEKDAIRKLGSIGRPMPHSHVFLLNKNNEKAKVNEIGEIVISGPHLCAGYYKDQQLFSASCFKSAFRTGDLAKFDSEGFYTIVGRKKDMYISGGENIYPAEVEKVILDIESVAQAIVVSRPDNKWGEVGVAFLHSTTHFSIEELRNLLTNKLSRYKHPHQIKYLEEFPLLANGKIDRKKLSEWANHSWRENESSHI
jgi:fatty-acyl-CoA synthase